MSRLTLARAVSVSAVAMAALLAGAACTDPSPGPIEAAPAFDSTSRRLDSIPHCPLSETQLACAEQAATARLSF